jgi:hypothetical protein
MLLCRYCPSVVFVLGVCPCRRACSFSVRVLDVCVGPSLRNPLAQSSLSVSSVRLVCMCPPLSIPPVIACPPSLTPILCIRLLVLSIHPALPILCMCPPLGVPICHFILPLRPMRMPSSCKLAALQSSARLLPCGRGRVHVFRRSLFGRLLNPAKKIPVVSIRSLQIKKEASKEKRLCVK